MKVIRVTEHGGPEVLKLIEMEEPKAGPGQVMIQVKAAGVNPVDTYIRAGAYSMKELPYTPGFDAAGVVERAGEGARFKPGDRVYTSATLTGAYAEKALADDAAVHPLPEKTSFAEGAALGIPYATAYRALFHRAAARPGETVLIHGATGGVGLAAVQFAKAAGLTIFATGGTPEGRELVRKHGADHVLDHKSSNYADELMALTSGRGVDVILEMLANVNLARDLTLLAKFGRAVVIGSRGPIEIDPRNTMAREASIHGMTLFNAPPADLQSIHAGIFAGLETGVLRPVIGTQLPLAEAARAHALVMEPGARGKIILAP